MILGELGPWCGVVSSTEIRHYLGMRIASTLLVGSINWRISNLTPDRLELGPEWEIVNPLIEVGAYLETPSPVIPLSNDEWFVTSRILNLVVPAGVTADEVMERVEHALRFLRVATRNPDLSINLAGAGINEVQELPVKAQLETPEWWKHGRVKWLWNRDRTTATLDQFAVAFREEREEPPVYASLALDAIAARSSDYKKCILFAAFAVESLAATLLDDEYERARAGQDNVAPWHFITLTVSASQTVRKDPIYEALRGQASNNAKIFLHELPLYVFGRSLLQDNQALYNAADSLRKSRNSIAHRSRGNAAGGLPIDHQGATQALQTARGIFEWFGLGEYFMEVSDL